MATPSDIEIADQLVTARVQQEFSLKDSLERRAQFFIGIAGTGTSLALVGAGLVARAQLDIASGTQNLAVAGAVLQISVAVVCTVLLLPIGLKPTTRASLSTMVENAAAGRDDAKSNAVTERSRTNLRLLQSLERQNWFKALGLLIAVVLELAGVVTLGFAFVHVVGSFN